jgi:membrane protein
MSKALNSKFATVTQWSGVVKAAFQHFILDQGFVLAGNMAFLSMLALFPFIIFLVALSGFFGQTQFGYDAIQLILTNLPPEASAAISKPISSIIQNTHGEILTFSILFALWTAATGVEAARAAVIRAHGGVYQRALWRRHLENLVIVITAAILAISAMGLLVLGPALLKMVGTYVSLPDGINGLWNWVRYFMSPLALYIAIYGLYLALSPIKGFKNTYRWPGTILALTLWLSTATGFSTYLKYMNTYDLTYGGLAGVMITQVFLFVVSMGFILGAELNAAYTKLKTDNIEFREENEPKN